MLAYKVGTQIVRIVRVLHGFFLKIGQKNPCKTRTIRTICVPTLHRIRSKTTLQYHQFVRAKKVKLSALSIELLLIWRNWVSTSRTVNFPLSK
jgi:hypothetical protein